MENLLAITENDSPACVVRFHCRMQTAVFDWFSRREQSFGKICCRAIRRFMKGVHGGRICTNARSDFYTRSDVRDKVECWLCLGEVEKEWLEKMSFAYKVSQSELVRMVLEWWMALHKDDMRGYPSKGYYLKWYHEVITARPIELFFSFWSEGQALIYDFPTVKEAQFGFDATVLS
jgi:hypothetical protein